MLNRRVGVKPTAVADAVLYRQIAILCILIALGIHTWLIINQSLHFMTRNDDTFYYFEVVNRFALGQGWTFDGINATNGVQPLWAAVLSVAASLGRILGVTDIVLLARGYMLIAVLANILGTYYFYCLAHRWLSARDALLVLVLWLLTPRMVTLQLEGMENALNLLILSLTLWLYFRLITPTTPRQTRPVAALAALGACLGLLFLVRIDNSLLIAPLVLHVSYRIYVQSSGPFFQRFRRWLAFAMPAMLLAGLYLAYNLLVHGHLLPISGVVKQYNNALTVTLLGGYLDPDFWLFAGRETVFALALVMFNVVDIGALGGLWQALETLPPLNGILLGDVLGTALNLGVMIAVLLVAFGLYLRWRRISLRLLFKNIFRGLRPLLTPNIFLLFVIAHVMLHVLFNTTYLIHSGVSWYWVPLYMYLMLCLAAVVGGLFDTIFAPSLPAMPAPSVRWRYSLALIAALALNLVVYLGLVAMPESDLYSQTAQRKAGLWISTHLPQGTRLGSFDAGVVGYFSQQPVVNLDGLANNYDLFDAYRQRRLDQYVLTQGIDYIVGYWPFPPTERGSWRGLSRLDEVVHTIPIYSQDVSFRQRLDDSLYIMSVEQG